MKKIDNVETSERISKDGLSSSIGSLTREKINKDIQKNSIGEFLFVSDYTISYENATTISGFTRAEEKLEYKSPEDIMKLAKNGYYAVYDQNNSIDTDKDFLSNSDVLQKKNAIIGCIFMTKYDTPFCEKTLLERGLLYIDKKYRNKGLATMLMMNITKDNAQDPIISVTSNPIVQEINREELGFIELLQKDLPGELCNILEQGGPLHDGYKYYASPALVELLTGTEEKTG